MSERRYRAMIIGLFFILISASIVIGYYVIRSLEGESPSSAALLPASETPLPVLTNESSNPTMTLEARDSPVPEATLITPTIVASPTFNVTTTPTFELTHTPGPTPEPTATTTIPPDPDICSRVNIHFLSATSNIGLWQLNNMNLQSAEITRISLLWPDQNGAVFNAFLNGTVIWSGGDLVSPTIITDWIGEPVNREVLGSTRLEFLFGFDAASSGYKITVELSNGCSASASN